MHKNQITIFTHQLIKNKAEFWFDFKVGILFGLIFKGISSEKLSSIDYVKFEGDFSSKSKLFSLHRLSAKTFELGWMMVINGGGRGGSGAGGCCIGAWT